MSVTSKAQKPLVSIVIPTYNRPTFLKEALKSAVEQTYQNIEIIVSDNCSDENPQELIESFQDPRIRFSRNQTNIGMFDNVMNAFKKARGKYVASLLDDDVWERDFLEKLVPPLEANPFLAIAFCDHYIINADGNIDEVATEQCSQFYKRANLREGIYQPFSKLVLIDKAVSPAFAALIRRDVVNWDNIPSEVGGLWDIYLGYLCSLSGRGAYYYPAKLTRCRVHEQTETMLSGKGNVQAKIRKGKAQIFCYNRFLEDTQLQEFSSYFKQKWVEANTTLGIGLLRNQKIEEARKYCWRSLQQQFNFRSLAAFLLSFTPPSVASRF